jgi:hypothetical protein
MTAKLPRPFVILALAILFSTPALACSFSNTPTVDSNSQETRMVAHIIATLTANAQILAAQISPTSSPVPAQLPTDTRIIAPTRTPTRTRTPTPNFSPTPTGTWFGAVTFAKGVTDDNHPIEPGSTFKKGVKQIYAIFPYSGMDEGTKYTIYWTVNGKEFVNAIHTWKWDPSGTYSTYTYYTSNADLDTGTWKFYFYVGNKLMTSGVFKIVP